MNPWFAPKPTDGQVERVKRNAPAVLSFIGWACYDAGSRNLFPSGEWAAPDVGNMREPKLDVCDPRLAWLVAEELRERLSRFDYQMLGAHFFDAVDEAERTLRYGRCTPAERAAARHLSPDRGLRLEVLFGAEGLALFWEAAYEAAIRARKA